MGARQERRPERELPQDHRAASGNALGICDGPIPNVLAVGIETFPNPRYVGLFDPSAGGPCTTHLLDVNLVDTMPTSIEVRGTHLTGNFGGTIDTTLPRATDVAWVGFSAGSGATQLTPGDRPRPRANLSVGPAQCPPARRPTQSPPDDDPLNHRPDDDPLQSSPDDDDPHSSRSSPRPANASTCRVRQRPDHTGSAHRDLDDLRV